MAKRPARIFDTGLRKPRPSRLDHALEPDEEEADESYSSDRWRRSERWQRYWWCPRQRSPTARRSTCSTRTSSPETVGINSVWVLVAGILVMFMQAGFAFLEIGFSRGKNAGTVVAKILVNFSIAALMFWAVGFAFAFGEGNAIIGTHGFFLAGAGRGRELPARSTSSRRLVTVETLWFFQFVFCAVSLAIVWGTTLERIKFGVYIIYAIVFSALIYPIGAHWIFGGGWLAASVGMQDFAGSTVVHLIGATGALAALLLLGPRRGKYGTDGKPRAIPGHNMPLFGLGILILWLGWFGFNPGSGLKALDGRFPEIAMVTNLAAAAGVLAAVGRHVLQDQEDRHRHGRQRRDRRARGDHRPVGLRRAVGGADHRRGRRRDRRLRRARDRQVDRRSGRRAVRARPGRHLGHARVRPVHGAAAGRYNAVGEPRPRLHGLVPPARRPGAGRRAPRSRSSSSFSFVTFWAIKKTYGMRVTRRGRGRRPGHRPSTACTATRSSSSRRPSSSGYAPPASRSTPPPSADPPAARPRR